MLNNCGPSGSPANAGTMTGVIHASGEMTVIYGDDKPCGRCGKTHPLEAGDETLKMMRTLTKALRRKFEEQKERIKELSDVEAAMNDREAAVELLEAAGRRHGLPLADQGQLAQLASELAGLETRRRALHAFFAEDALWRWDRKSNTDCRGCMAGVLVCKCKAKRLGAGSGKAPPAFVKIVGASGMHCASPPVSAGPTAPEGWACAAKHLIEKVNGHKPVQLIERWFAPIVRGLRFTRGPRITFWVLVEDPVTTIRSVEIRTQRFAPAENVPSCDKCQANLPEMFCDTQCG